MSRPGTWPSWQPQPGTENPGHGGMSQLAAYDAGLTDDPGCWVQPIDIRDPRLKPESPEYDPEYAAEVAWEERGAAEFQAEAESHQPDTGPEPDAELELPF